MADAIFTPTDVTTDLGLFEKTLHQLSVDYELFFASRADGKTSVLPPYRRLQEVEAIVRHYTKRPPHRTVDRFRFNTLVHRYRTSSERWRRRMKAQEELGIGRGGALARPRWVEDPSQPQVLAATQLRAGQASGAQVRDVYLAFRKARRARGLPVAGLTYRTFADQLTQRLEYAREHAPGSDLELRVDEVGGKVRVVMQPVRERPKQPAAPLGVGGEE